jgi:hypothetical protein
MLWVKISGLLIANEKLSATVTIRCEPNHSDWDDILDQNLVFKYIEFWNVIDISNLELVEQKDWCENAKIINIWDVE